MTFEQDISPKLGQYGIDIDTFTQKYEAEHLREILTRYPTLCYLLGTVEPAVETETGQQIRDSRPDGIERPIWFLKEGSGMFCLSNPDDAMRWRGIFNHAIGSARFVERLATVLSQLSEEQMLQFTERGYDAESFKKINPQHLRDFMFVTHAARRKVDERGWHGIHDEIHPDGPYSDVRDSGILTERILKEYGAPEEFIELIAVEQHADHLIDLEKGGKFSDLRYAILTYSDWIFGQNPATLEERFALLEKSGRETKEVLDKLKHGGMQFEKDLREITGLTWEEIVQTPLPRWEYDIREAYSVPSGLSAEHVFPAFWELWQEQAKSV